MSGNVSGVNLGGPDTSNSLIKKAHITIRASAQKNKEGDTLDCECSNPY